VLRVLTLLQSGESMSVEQLTSELGISRRTLFRDLNTLKAAGIPCYHDPKLGYRLAPSFFLPPVNLKISEALGLMTLAKAAHARRDQPLLSPAVDAVRKLVAAMPEAMREVCHDVMRNISVRPGHSAQVNGDATFYPVLQQAIDEKRHIRMRYLSLHDGGVIDVRLRPLHLHFATRAWYVIGYCEKEKQIRTYKLARIQDAQLLKSTFTAPAFSIDEYLGKAWQMIPEGKVHRVELEFTAKVGTNVAEVRWHHTQEHTLLDDGRCIVTFEVDGLGEITWWLLGYGDQVVVRKPVELRRKLRDVYRSAAAQYD
jgi:proteasome accessory factor B